ncbi:MAG: hypothetical protein M0C28_14355 [Candidatus Moduliflexus flocculans]|nr:hypothetical protein [Candidatus Moduliflexus flocculans]
MSRKRLKTIGVLGGMGPEAGAAFFERIVRETAAGPRPGPSAGRPLQPAPDPGPDGGHPPRRPRARCRPSGADSAALAARRGGFRRHVVHLRPLLPAPARSPRSPLPLISLIDETVAAIGKMKPVPGPIGLMATDGTVRSGIFARAFEAAGIAVHRPLFRRPGRG